MAVTACGPDEAAISADPLGEYQQAMTNAGGDLRITYGHVTATASSSATAVPYSVRVTNISTVASKSTQVKMYLNTHGTLGSGGPDYYMCTYALPAIAAGASHVQTGSCPIPAINRSQGYYAIARFAAATTYEDRYGVPSQLQYYFGPPRQCRYETAQCPYSAGTYWARLYCCD